MTAVDGSAPRASGRVMSPDVASVGRAWGHVVPRPLRSARFRLGLLYSLALTAVAAAVVIGLNVMLGQTLQASDPLVFEFQDPFLGTIRIEQYEQSLTDFATLVDQRALARLGELSLIAVVGLFPVSLLIGWLVAGRVLRPIARITAVAREIGATDLSRRIDLRGPDDELTRMAGTFDAMLERIERGAEGQRAFVEEISHELRNPLAVITTSIDVVLAEPDPDPAELRRALEVTRRASERMSRQVDALVTVGRHRGTPEERRTVDLGVLARESAAEYEMPARARGVRIAVRAEGSVQLFADAVALRQALGNLVTNAIRHAPGGSTITLGVGRTDGWSWLGVADQGPGIPEAHHALIFRRHWRAAGAGAPAEGSEGLGLAIVRQIAEAHGGTITVDAAPGQGARFIIWLPSARPSAGRSASISGPRHGDTDTPAAARSPRRGSPEPATPGNLEVCARAAEPSSPAAGTPAMEERSPTAVGMRA